MLLGNSVFGEACGIVFSTDGQSVYRENVLSATTGICGSVNIDGGGNVLIAPTAH